MSASKVQEVNNKGASVSSVTLNFTASTPVAGQLVIVSVQGYRSNGQDATITVAGYGVTTWNSFHIAANAGTEFGWSHLAWGWVDGTPTKNGTVSASSAVTMAANGSEYSGVPSSAITTNSPATKRQKSVTSSSLSFSSESDTYLLYVTGSDDSSNTPTGPSSPWQALTAVGTPGGSDQLNLSYYLSAPGSGTKTATFSRPSSDSFYLIGVQFDVGEEEPTGPSVEVTVPENGRLGASVEVSATATPGDGTIDDDTGYNWELTTKPSGSSATIASGQGTDSATFVPDKVGTYTVKCTVTDSNSLTADDSGDVNVSAGVKVFNGTDWSGVGIERVFDGTNWT